jgi:lyso-ornithine lipid O-acyltransferase
MPPRSWRGRYRRALQSLWAKAMWRILGLRVEVRGKCPSDGPFLVVSNHLGYLDIAVLSGILPVTFVSKAEVRGWLFIGFLARSVGTIFVFRKDRRQAKDLIEQVRRRMSAGENILVFPEGTSSRGEIVLPFKTAAFAAVSGVPGSRILPVRIDLLNLYGETAAGPNRDIACWYGDMEFAPHFWNFLGSGGARFRVRIGEPFDGGSLDRKSIAQVAYRTIENLGKSTSSERTLLPGNWIWIHAVL